VTDRKVPANTIVVGDALQTLRALPDASVDHCITDPPYNISGYDDKRKIGWIESNPTWKEQKRFEKIDEAWDSFSDDDYSAFTRAWLTEVSRVLKPNGNLLVFGSYHNIYLVGSTLDQMGLKINNSIVWYKRNAFPNITGRMLCESTEQIVWAVNGTKKKAKNWVFNYEDLKQLTANGKQMRNMWDIPMTPRSEKEFGKHPSQKPLVLSKRLIIGFTRPDEVIIDPFVGSGSFLVAAKGLGRDFLGIEQDAEYADLATRRLRSVKRGAMLLEDPPRLDL
jgi:site-specific DNA-methyltransferase (adenine-specific)